MSISCGNASSTTRMLPPVNAKPPSTMTSSTTSPMTETMRWPLPQMHGIAVVASLYGAGDAGLRAQRSTARRLSLATLAKLSCAAWSTVDSRARSA